ncbi:MAG: ribulose-phosphate 3-epimerase [Patescibacteria group bacterium]
MARPYQLSASLICGSPATLAEELKALEAGGMDALHFDVMDGSFVPRLGLYPELLASVKELSTLPVDVHLMIDDPERYAKVFIDAGADIMVVHAESTKHLHQTIRTIRALGARAGVALNPATSLSVLDYVLGDIELVMLMAINPGILGHKLIPSMMDKISDLRTKLEGYPGIRIEIDGGVSPESAAAMVNAGADLLVCGTSAVYKKGPDLAESVRSFRNHIDAELARTS